MPLVTITMLKGRSAEKKSAIKDAVHNALVSCFKIPQNDRLQRLIELAPEDFDIPTSEGKTEEFTIIEMSIFPGRTVEMKRKLYQEIVGDLGMLGIKPLDVFIVLNEVPMDNWGLRGGIPGSELYAKK